jgi:hypothetical protein
MTIKEMKKLLKKEIKEEKKEIAEHRFFIKKMYKDNDLSLLNAANFQLDYYVGRQKEANKVMQLIRRIKNVETIIKIEEISWVEIMNQLYNIYSQLEIIIDDEGRKL